MTYQTRRRLKRTIKALRIERDEALAGKTELQAAHEVEKDGLRHVIRDIGNELAAEQSLNRELQRRLDTANSEIETARGRIEEIITGAARGAS